MSIPETQRSRGRIRSSVENIRLYKPGKPAAADSFKVSSNESHLPPLPAIRDAVIEEIDRVNRYPVDLTQTLAELLAHRHGVEPEQIHLSTGASAVLGELVRATVDEGGEVIYPWRSFELYPILVAQHGGTPVAVPLNAGHRTDLEAMLAAITDRTQLILLCSPNNPDGAVMGEAELRTFLDRVPDHIPVGLDEAYAEFAGPAQPDMGAIFRDYENTVRLRTFSKVHGIAGLRLGYGIAHPDVAVGLRRAAPPFAANSLALAAGIAALRPDVQKQLAERTAWVVSERERMRAGITRDLPESGGNFIYLPLGADTPAFVEFADSSGLVVRGYGEDGVRISVGEEEANSLSIRVVNDWDAR